MATEFPMPQLGLTMEAGTIIEWLVADGATVTEGQAVLVIETDKVDTEVESSGAGVLHQTAAVGDTVPCGGRIGVFLEPGEEAPSAAPVAEPEAALAPPPEDHAGSSAAPPVAPAAATTPDGRLLASPNARRVAAELGVDIGSVHGTGPGGRIVSEDVEAAAAAGSAAPAPTTTTTPPAAATSSAAAMAASGSAGRGASVLASVAARQLADLLGIDLATVPTAAPDPRITRDDVARHVRSLLAPEPAPGPSAGAPAPSALPEMPLLQEPTEVIPLTGMRGTIASRMHGALTAMAQLTLMTDVDMSAVIADRDRRNAAGAAPGFTDYVIGAVARALIRHPVVNSQVTADGVALLPQVNVGLAVALDDGLIVPVVQNTPALTLEALSAETSRLAEAARTGTLGLADLEGGTFSVTALGMYGVDGFTPVINPPNTAILGVGRLKDAVTWDGDRPTKTTMLTLSLTWDHRAFDGAPAAAFAQTVKSLLEAV